MVCWGIHFQVTGDGHRYREFRCRPFGHRELAPGFRRLMAKRLIPERLTTVAVTRHPKRIMSAGLIPVSGLPLRDETLPLTDGSESRPSPLRFFYNNRYFLYLITAGGD